ncbi:MoaD/ThiS family protein [Pseudidiomarina sp. CB1]|uniref:MoaD/ThiS family protein n=1 Tax=Pseudidiomarina sp. CB1 TaxID=2972484 RepID=UPI002161CC7D|nr:MoaD/ThiS family protein [Pseudidiomarina sp. CB1]
MVKVKFFAMLRERLNCNEIDVDLPAGATVQQLREKLALLHPDWTRELYDQELLCAKNYTFVDWDEPLVDGDEVALFPPVTGG